MLSPIEQLPAELVDLITADFDLPEYQHFRLASRQTHHVTRPSFYRCYFARRTTTLAASSLDRLLAASACRHVAHHVSSLYIRIPTRTTISILRDISRVGIYPPPKRFPTITDVRWGDCSHEVVAFDQVMSGETNDTNGIIDQLSRAMRRFSNLKAVHIFYIRHTGSYRDFMSSDPPADSFKITSLSFKTIVAAVVKSGVHIEQLNTNEPSEINKASKAGKSVFILPLALDLPADQFRALGPAFSSLRVLVLSLRFDPPVYRRDRQPYQDYFSPFINCATALEELRLSIQNGFINPKSTTNKQVVTQSVARSVRLPRLKLFAVRHAVCLSADMLIFIKAHASSLRHLNMHDCCLPDGGWTTVLESFRELGLEYLRLSNLKYPLGDVVPHFVLRWPTSRDGTLKRHIVLDVRRKSERRSMDEMLTDCTSRMHPTMYPPTPP
ncbi:hypothetical protein P280DRAFT_232005 [Massarina eburnea CBS 473.64]|uniref:Uncharacterized protein n=1 Tax=Massarina eburnea CBS 473.64 TaxID=1395130 RepID=A0A6A6RHW7_9PLEO|nr:hypothetical protein P280DRAFT_232005 [Massarina eburnea CBS 473.64]